MPDDAVLQITTVVDTTQVEALPGNVSPATEKAATAVKAASEQMSQAFASAEQSSTSLQQKISSTSADLAQATAAAKIQAESLRDAYKAYGDDAAQGDEEILRSLGDQEAALASTKAQVISLREELQALIDKERELGASAASLSSPGLAAPAVTGGAGNTGTDESTSGAASTAEAESMAALATAEASTAESTERLTAAEQDFELVSTQASSLALSQARSLAVLSESESQRSNLLAQSRGLESLAVQESERHATAETQLAAQTNTANESAMLSAEAWQEAFAAESQDTVATEELSTAKSSNTVIELANTEAVRSGISDRMAASASLRTLELNLQGSTRAAGTFLTEVLGLGPALQAAFPVIGAIALGEVLITVGQRVYELYQNIVNLKAEIAALGEASEKTAKQAADANWKWIESQAEILKSQGKIKEAQELLAASSGEKPISLSLGLDDKKLKDLPQEIQDFAQKLKEVHTQAQAESVFKELDAQMSSTHKKIEDFQSEIATLHARIQQQEANPTGRDAEAQLIVAEAAQIESYQHRLTAASEYYNVLQNLRNTNISDTATEASKVSEMDVSALQRSAEEARSNLSAIKTVQEAKASLAEQEAERELQIGQITKTEELNQVQQIETKKLSAIIQAQEAVRSAIEAEASKSAAISENIAQTALAQHRITQQQEVEMVREAEQEKLRATQQIDAEISSERLKLQQDTIKNQIAADQEQLNEMLRSIDVQVEATKTGSAQRVSLIESEVQLVGLFYNYQGEEYEKMLAKLATADRERTAEIERQTTQELELKLRSIKEAADAEAQATAKSIADQQKQLDEVNRVQQAGLRGSARDSERLGLPDIGKVAAIFQQMQDAENRYIQNSITLAQQAADAKIAALKRIEDAAELAALADPSNSSKFIADAQDAANKQIAIEQELQAKLKQLREQGAEEDKKIEQQLVQYKEQEEQKITSKMLQYEDQALFHSKSFGQAMMTIYKDLAQSAINEVLQMANKWIAEHVIMAAFTRLFHSQNTADEARAYAQSFSQTVTNNVATVTSEAAVAAAKAYAANAESPAAAAAAAGAAEATVLSFIPEAAAEGGFDVPFGSSPVTKLHPQEMVLPDHLANTVRNMAQIAPELTAPSFSFQMPHAIYSSQSEEASPAGDKGFTSRSISESVRDLVGQPHPVYVSPSSASSVVSESLASTASASLLAAQHSATTSANSESISSSSAEIAKHMRELTASATLDHANRFLDSSMTGLAPSFDEGGLVPEDMLARVHRGELIVPESHAPNFLSLMGAVPGIAPPALSLPSLPEFAQAMARGEFGGSINQISSQSNSAESGDELHFHAGDVHASALDRSGVADILRSHQTELAKTAAKILKSGRGRRR